MPRRGLRTVLVLSLLAGACAGRTDESDAVPEDPASVTLWRTLGVWEGRGDRQTESFDIHTGSLRVTWEGGESAPADGRLRVTLHSAISGRPLHTVVDDTSGESGTVHVATEPRVAYLLIESELVDWRVTLEEGVRDATR